MKNLFLIVVTVLLGYGCGQSQKSRRYEITDLKTKVICSGEGKFYCRANLTEAVDGTWVMVYTESSGHAALYDKLHIRFSKDFGNTWTAEDTFFDGAKIERFPGDPPPEDCEYGHYQVCEGYLYTMPNGDLVIITWQKSRLCWRPVQR